MEKLFSDEEAQRIIYLHKKFLTDKVILTTFFDEEFDLISVNNEIRYILTVRNSKHQRLKITIQKREKNTQIPLVRLDTHKKHMNPDGTIIEGNHIHIYKEGYKDSWAYPLPYKHINFSNLSDFKTTFLEFLEFFNIEKIRLVYQSIHSIY